MTKIGEQDRTRRSVTTWLMDATAAALKVAMAVLVVVVVTASTLIELYIADMAFDRRPSP